ncbi:MAG: alpha/beta hydrolase [Chloroflexota bacterium]
MFSDIHANENNLDECTTVIHKSRSQSNQHAPSSKMQKKYRCDTVNIGGFTLHRIKKERSQKAFLYFHGGAYVVGPSSLHWPMIDQIVNQSGYEVALFDYPKAPEFTAEEAIKQSTACYEHLLAEYEPEDIFLMGDSAGAGLAAGLLIHLREEEKPQPAQLILLYPWLDVTMPHSESVILEPKDLLLTVEGLRTCGRLYAGEKSVTDPLISPIYGSWEGLPPVQIFTGTEDILHPQAKALKSQLTEAKHPFNYYQYEKMQHAWMILPIPEAKKAINELVAAVC